MIYISADKRINDFCNALLRSGRWNFYRGGKHSILKHKAPTSRKALVVAVTPSKGNAFKMLEREYNHYIRAYLIQTGVIIA
ncbi:hypothetical protein [uncultured Fibrobacter sp.]|uniref:hypothetical protein n=1 Tax=uncultured Fibrobacter sp. TaxID=261512 RepID=UPI00262E45B3|nr:hypothetical protein [uncultured Fibrobacter sp.]